LKESNDNTYYLINLLFHIACVAQAAQAMFIYYTMALEEFENERLSTRDKGIIRMRSITNYGMGIFLVIAGGLLLFPAKFVPSLLKAYEASSLQMFAVICLIYGLFRIYRGYKKNYFRNS